MMSLVCVCATHRAENARHTQGGRMVLLGRMMMCVVCVRVAVKYSDDDDHHGFI